jgi:hypothetical protein
VIVGVEKRKSGIVSLTKVAFGIEDNRACCIHDSSCHLSGGRMRKQRGEWTTRKRGRRVQERNIEETSR